MGRREYEKQRAKAAMYIGIGQLLQGGAQMVQAYQQRHRDALKQASLERLQKQQFDYQKDRDIKNDEYRQAQLAATKANAESSRAIQQQNADTQKQLAELSATKHNDDKALREQQLVMNQLNGFNKQVVDIRERVATGEINPEAGKAMEMTLNQQKAEYLTGLQQSQPELLSKLGFALPKPANNAAAQTGFTPAPATDKSRLALLQQYMADDIQPTPQQQQQADTKAMLGMNDQPLTQGFTPAQQGQLLNFISMEPPKATNAYDDKRNQFYANR